MEAVVSAFRGSKRSQRTTAHVVLVVKGIADRKKAETLVGKSVSWTSPAGKKIVGEIRAAHGKAGAVRAIFERGLPGQALGTKVQMGA
ncbi:MAG: 50S ribosomal protein L35ae [archaeon]